MVHDTSSYWGNDKIVIEIKKNNSTGNCPTRETFGARKGQPLCHSTLIDGHYKAAFCCLVNYSLLITIYYTYPMERETHCKYMASN